MNLHRPAPSRGGGAERESERFPNTADCRRDTARAANDYDGPDGNNNNYSVTTLSHL